MIAKLGPIIIVGQRAWHDREVSLAAGRLATREVRRLAETLAAARARIRVLEAATRPDPEPVYVNAELANHRVPMSMLGGAEWVRNTLSDAIPGVLGWIEVAADADHVLVCRLDRPETHLSHEVWNRVRDHLEKHGAVFTGTPGNDPDAWTNLRITGVAQ